VQAEERFLERAFRRSIRQKKRHGIESFFGLA